MGRDSSVLPLTLFIDPRVDKAQSGKLEEGLRSYMDCKHVYSLQAAAESLQRWLRQTKVAQDQVGTQAQCYQGQQYCCLQNMRYEAVQEWDRRS